MPAVPSLRSHTHSCKPCTLDSFSPALYPFRKDCTMQPVEHDSFGSPLVHNSQADAGLAEQALADFAKSQQLSRKNAAQLIFGHDQADPKGKSFGDWLVCVRKNDWRTLERKYQSFPSDGKSALNTSIGTQGGYLVPTEFTDKLLQTASEKSVVRPRATLIPMASRAVQVPCLDSTTVPASSDSAFLGGIVARWTEESITFNETEPVFRQVELVAHELSGYSRVSNSLLEDSAIGLEQLLITLFGRAIAWHEDHAFLRGDGVGKPLGILNSNALISVARSAARAFALEDAATMLAASCQAGNLQARFGPCTLVLRANFSRCQLREAAPFIWITPAINPPWCSLASLLSSLKNCLRLTPWAMFYFWICITTSSGIGAK
ncbi:MAG: phage major capsid protein [Planctomycetes bacterium]|nr:phage major capsid protein [Planctomycetota bacterium]